MSESFIIYTMQANSLALTKTCEVEGKMYIEKTRYRDLNKLYEDEKGNEDLIIGRGRFFFYVLTPDNKYN